MKELQELLTEAQELVNRSIQDIEWGNVGLKEVEERVVELANRVGGLLVDQIVEGIREPVFENRVWVEGKRALYKGSEAMCFINRFGTKVRRKRRGYQIEGESGRWYPLDEKLGTDRCCGYSPLMSYLLSFFGSSEPYRSSSRKLSSCLGFSISATAVQRNTEEVGRRLEGRPIRSIDGKRQDEACELMVVEVDGTTSPQIMEEEGVTGRESLKLPTEYKECNVMVVEKLDVCGTSEGKHRYQAKDRWTGAMYGERAGFERYVHEAGLRMGQLMAEQVLFIADGAKHNWEIQLNNFPNAVKILDVYHAIEHLADYCGLFTSEAKGKQYYGRWREMMLDGETLQLIHELKEHRSDLSDRDKGQKHINYFLNNQERMAYDEYRAKGYPIGSGLVEGSCKFVVGKRFKGSGMRWKRLDNQYVLKARLAELNGDLVSAFAPKVREITPLDPNSQVCQPGAARA